MASEKRKRRWLVIITILTFAVSGISPNTHFVGAINPGENPPTTEVDPAIWTAAQAEPGADIAFTAICPSYTPHCMEESGILPVFSVMQRVGSLSDFSITSDGVLRASGSAGGIRFLASLSSLDRISLDSVVTNTAISQPGRSTGVSATGRITGTVTGSDGLTPLNGIIVTAYRYNGIIWISAGTTSTGIDGTYNLTGLPATTFRLYFSDSTGTYVNEYYNDQRDAPSDLSNLIILFEGETRGDIDASLALAGFISGTITKVSNGDPVADFVASAYQYRNGLWRLDGSGVTDGSGDYEIRGLAAGSYLIRFADPYSPPRYLEEWYDNVLTRSEATYVPLTAGVTTTNINASLGSYGSIAGTVIGPLGLGLEDITANIWQYNSIQAQWELLGGNATDENGDYSVPGLITRDYRVEFFDSTGQYGTEYYNNKTTVETGNDVHVELGYETPNINATLALAPDAVDHDLAVDWNLISLPVYLDDPSTVTTLETITGTYDVVWAYDGCVPEWLKFDLADPLSSLTEITTTQGLWIDQAVAATLTVTGTHPLATEISLCVGWNLIGYPSVSSKPVTEVLSPIAGKYDLIYTYVASDVADPWKKYNPNFPIGNDLTTMQTWQGYWILMNQSATLTIDGR